MNSFKHLNQLNPHIDDAFASFYDAMLNDIRLSVFFEDDAQIRSLIEKQKQHFTASLNMPEDVLKQSYIKLGEFHYDIRIPYVDFIKGTEILQEHFLLNTQRHQSSIDLMDEIFEYFKMMKSFTAKGYLNKMIEEDKRDIDLFFNYTEQEEETYLPKVIIYEKINWLKELLHCIESNSEYHFKNEKSLLKQWIHDSNFLTFEKRNFFEDLEQRILINTQNLFYFLKREDYLEMLPLYTSLLSIYKLTLMMNNAVTIEYANNLIENMKVDSLTGLFRKDLFEELLKKEIALTQMEENYFFSVAYLNLDNFTQINENFGNFSGDKVLEKMGELIRKNIRASDLALRVGGDEFAIIFKNSTKKEASNVCKKIKVDFSAFEFAFNKEVIFSVSVSMGISEFPHQSKKDIDELLESLNKKVHEAKSRGKNQICL